MPHHGGLPSDREVQNNRLRARPPLNRRTIRQPPASNPQATDSRVRIVRSASWSKELQSHHGSATKQALNQKCNLNCRRFEPDCDRVPKSLPLAQCVVGDGRDDARLPLLLGAFPSRCYNDNEPRVDGGVDSPELGSGLGHERRGGGQGGGEDDDLHLSMDNSK